MAKSKKSKKKKKSSSGINVMAGDFAQASDGQNGNRVYFSIGKTCNIGNFESIRVEVGQGMALEAGASLGDFNRARNVCVEEATEAIKEIVAMIDAGKSI